MRPELYISHIVKKTPWSLVLGALNPFLTPCAEPAEGPGGGAAWGLSSEGTGPGLSLWCPRSSRGWRRAWAGREGLCLTSPSVCVTVDVVIATVPRHTVIVGLILRTDPANGQDGCFAGAGAREPENGRIYLKYWKGKIYNQDYCTQKGSHSNWWRNKKLFRQAKGKRIQYHQTSFIVC